MRYLWLILIMAIVAACAGPMAPEDCFEDEVYDEVDQVCYLACELDGTCEEVDAGFGGWLSGFIDAISGYALGAAGEGNVVVTYDVEQNGIANPQLGEAGSDDEYDIQENEEQHAEMWAEFAQIIPSTSRQEITQFGVFTDGKEETLAFVQPVDASPLNWMLAIDPSDVADKKELQYTLVHEFGHVLTLNNNQVPFDEAAYFAEDQSVADAAANACPTYFTGEGCSKQDSYINLFVDKFWTSLLDEHSQIDPQDPDALYAFYEENQDQFVTDYAATNVGEDITESWAHFVLRDKPTGNSVADQKVLFFYDFPELIELRSEILRRAYSDSRR